MRFDAGNMTTQTRVQQRTCDWEIWLMAAWT